MKQLLVLLCAGLLIATVSNTPVIDAHFWTTWGDGQAELAGYELTIPRYGQLRHGTAVTIFVSETFSNKLRVKADTGKHPPSDEFPVMKLNLIEDFQTGIYDYNEMTSTFVALAAVNGRPAGYPTKITSSQQEWCGQVFQELLFDPQSIRYQMLSYFDGEGDTRSQIAYPETAFSGDALMLWARGVAAPTIAPGAKQEVQILPSLQWARHSHHALAWTKAVLSRTAGKADTEVYTAAFVGGPTRTYIVEKAEPHRILRWESSDGERAQLLKSVRLKYWQLNHPGGESYLKQLGLSPRPPKTT